MAGKYLAGRFADLIQSGTFQLHLDSKTFSADTSIRFLQGDRFGTSPKAQFGCLEGFGRVVTTSNASQDALGCGRCLLFLWTAVTRPCQLRGWPQSPEGGYADMQSGEPFIYLFSGSVSDVQLYAWAYSYRPPGNS